MSKRIVTIIQTFRAERRITVEVDAEYHDSAVGEFQSGSADIPDFDDARWKTGWNLQSEDYE